ncbi:O-antigen polymerase [Fontibacter flavus]|uniref:O-antigen polymerase n=1 Tax=Fontibacter flavus TaxID=654838 RepID=A0ABV6FW27_9BACT
MKKYFILLYIILPPIFYIIPYFFANENNEVTLHFFKTFIVSKYLFLQFSITYLALGFFLIWFLNGTNFNLEKRKPTSLLLEVILSICFFIYFFVSISYLAIIFYAITYIIIGSYKPGKLVFIALFFISFYQLLFNNSRFPIIYTGLIYSLGYIQLINYKRLFIYGLASLFFLIYILQPLRSGILPFSSQSEISSFIYFYQHINPIYIGAYLSYDLNFGFTVLVSEIIPFAKSVLNYESVIDRLAEVGLPKDIIDLGIRHGSNSSMYFHVTGIIIISLSFFLIKKLLIFFRYNLINNALLFYFIVQAPFFIRRAIASYLLDVIVIIFISLIFVFIKQNNKKYLKNMVQVNVKS